MREVKRERVEDAQKRQAAHDVLTPSQQIGLLDKKLGKGQGAIKERTRLAKMIDAGQTDTFTEIEQEIIRRKMKKAAKSNMERGRIDEEAFYDARQQRP